MKTHHKLIILGGSGVAALGLMLHIMEQFKRETEEEQERINAQEAQPLTIDAEELGDKIGSGKQVIYQYENGKSKPPMDKLKLLAEAFNVSTSYFFEENQANNVLSVSDWKGEAYRKLESEVEYLRGLVETLVGKKAAQSFLNAISEIPTRGKVLKLSTKKDALAQAA